MLPPSLNIFCVNIAKAQSNITQQKENWRKRKNVSCNLIYDPPKSYNLYSHCLKSVGMCGGGAQEVLLEETKTCNIKVILWRQLCQKKLSFFRRFAHQSKVEVRNYEKIQKSSIVGGYSGLLTLSFALLKIKTSKKN